MAETHAQPPMKVVSFVTKKRETPLLVRVRGSLGERGEAVANNASRCEIYPTSVVMARFYRDVNSSTEYSIETRKIRRLASQSLRDLREQITKASEETLFVRDPGPDPLLVSYYAHRIQTFDELIATVKIHRVTLRNVSNAEVQQREGNLSKKLMKYLDETCDSVPLPKMELLKKADKNPQ